MFRGFISFFGATAAILAIASMPMVNAKAPAAPAEPKELYAIVYNPGPAWQKGLPMEQQALRPHGLYYRDLLTERRVHAAGRLGEQDGLAIVWASDSTEAQAILRNDPAIITGIFVGVVSLWRPRFKSADPLP